MVISLNLDIKKVTPINHPDNILLQNITIEMKKPGLIWIQGPNGSGKSILSSVLSGKAFFKGSGLNVEGGVHLETTDGRYVQAVDTNSAKEYAENVAFLPQKLGSSLLAIHHQDDICFGIEGRFPDITGETNKEKDQNAILQLRNIVENLNVWAHLTTKLGQSSYGETRRIEFACSISPYPYISLVILDEPFSGLDPHYQGMIKRAITEFAANHKSIWVITSHEPPDKYNLKPDEIIELSLKPTTEYIFQLVSQTAVQRFTKNRAKEIEAVRCDNLMIERHLPRESRLELCRLEAEPGKVTWLQGDNGTGKSTICQVLAGLLSTSWRWKITVAGNVQGGPYDLEIPKAPNDKVRMTLQNPSKSFIYRTVEEDLRKPHSPSETESDLGSDFWNELSLRWGRTDRRSSTFSFGQLKFLQLLLIPNTVEVVILDEPLLGIHPSLHSIMMSTLTSIAESGRVVIATCQSGLIDLSMNTVYTLASPK